MKKIYFAMASILMLSIGYSQTNTSTSKHTTSVNGNVVGKNLNNNLNNNSSSFVSTAPVDLHADNHPGHEHCPAHTKSQAMYEEMGVWDQYQQSYNDGLQSMDHWGLPKTPGTNTIAVIFHVVHEGEPVGTGTNVSNADIMAVFQDLVEDFSLTNADAVNARTGLGFNPANTGINFCLATQDPMGVPLAETGVTRFQTTETWFDPDNPSEENAMKSAPFGSPIWDRDKYLNVWICDISNGAGSGTAGYAYVPSMSFLPNPSVDGIVIDYNLGVNNDNVLTHEVGHYLGLYHTWGSGGCTVGTDDGFTDTPHTQGPSFNYSNSCNFGSGQQTCSGIETQFENYMDYSNCTCMFTTEQANYMLAILTGVRSSLLLSPGCDPAGPPVCAFTSLPAGPSPVVVATNGTVVFNDASTGAPTGWTWTITGGTQGVDWDYTGGTNANSQNPEVTFYTVGNYTVSLVASNGFGSCGGTTEVDYVQVVAPTVGTGCDTLRNWDPADADLNGFFVYNPVVGGSGQYPGHYDFDGTPDLALQIAESFNYTGTAEVRRLRFPVFTATAGTGAQTIEFRVYAGGATPGAILASEVVDINNLNAGAYNEVDFTTPATVTGQFYVGVALTYGTGDQVLFGMTNTITGGDDNVWTDWSTTGWAQDMGPGSWALDVMLSNGPAPVADFQFSEAAVCPGGDITVSGAASQNTTDYYWYQTDDPFTTIITSNFTAGTTFNFPGPAGNYAIYLFVDGSCMTDALVLPVTVNPAVSASVAVTNTTCGDNNGSVSINGATGGDGSYEYSLDGSNWQTGNTFTNLPAGNYTAYVRTGGDACETQIPFTVNGSSPLSGSVSPSTQGICPGGSATITASGGTGYTWYDGATVVGSTATLNVNPSVTTIYSCEITDGTCTDIQYANVTVHPLPAVSAGVDQAVCAGTSVTLSGSGASSYTWDNGVSDGVPFTPASTTTYTVTGTDGNGCQNTDQVVVTVNALPSVNAGTDVAICNGNSTNITATGATSYNWDQGLGAGATHTVSPGSNTTYTVTGTDGNGCVNTDQVVVTVNTLPTVNAGTDVAICNGNSTNITATGATSYNWDQGLGAGATHTVSPGSTTTYTVTGTDGNGCQNTDAIVVTVNALPSVNAGTDQTVCNGDMVTLNGSGAVSYSWDNGVTDGIPFSASATTTYTVTGTDGNGCQNTDQVVVTVNALPSVNAGTDVAICNGNSTNITATGATSYNWDQGLGAGATHSVSPGSTTTYTVTGTDGNGCVNTDQVVVTVNTLPTVNAGTDVAICNGNSTNITATGATSYNWDQGLGAGATHTVSPGSTTTYTVTGTDGNGCQNTDAVVVTVNALPSVNAGSDQIVCSGNMVTLSGSGASSYTWDNGITDALPFSATATTTYTVVGTDGNGCQNTDQVTVTVNPNPTTSNLTETCNGTNTAYEVSFDVSGGTGPYTVTGETGTFAGPTWTSSFIPSGNSYSLIITDANGCQATTVSGSNTCSCTTDAGTMNGTTITTCGTGAVTATHNADEVFDGDDVMQFIIHDNAGATLGTQFGTSGTPTFSFGGGMVLGTTYYISAVVGNNLGGGVVDLADPCLSVAAGTPVVWYAIPSVGAGTDQTVCENDMVTLSGTGASSYSWDNGVTNNTPFAATTTTTYTVTGTDGNGCQNTDQVTVTVNPLPSVNAGTDIVICNGSSTNITATGASSYNWDQGLGAGATHTVSPVSNTTYTVTGTDGNGCVNTDAVVITVNALPTVNAGTDQTVCENTMVTLSGSGATSYSWDNGVTDGTPFAATATTTYTVVGTDGNGCQNSDQVTVTVNPIPNVNAGTDQTVCENTMVTLSGSGATSYSWDNGVTNGIPFAATATTTYTVTGTDGNGCQNTDQVTVTVNALPTVNAGADVGICNGSSTNITATGASTYTWNQGLGAGATHTVSPGSTTTYTVTGTDGNGCVNTDAVIITVNGLPTVNAGPDQTVCENAMVTLSGSGASTYVWDNGVTDGTPFAATSTTTYTVTGTDVNGCQGTDQVTITVNTVPTVDAGADVSVCDGSAVTLTGSGANSYSWDNGVSNGVPFTPTATTTYTVTGTDINGCQNTDQVIVTVNPLPTISAGADQTVCQGDMVTLSGSGGSTYNWDNGISDGVPFTANFTTTYTVTGSDVNGCQGTDQVTVNVNILPTVDAGLDTAICGSGMITFTGSGASTYVWDNGVTDGTPFNVTTTTTFTVTGTDINGCSNTDSVTVTVGAGPSISGVVTHDTGIGDGAIDVTITGGTPPMTITWDNGPTTEDQSGLSAGDYTITVTDSTGCAVQATFTILNTMGVEDNTLNNSLLIYPNPSMGQFTIKLEGNYTFEIMDARGRLVLSNFANNNHEIDLSAYEAGVYFIRVKQDGQTVVRKLMLQ